MTEPTENPIVPLSRATADWLEQVAKIRRVRHRRKGHDKGFSYAGRNELEDERLGLLGEYAVARHLGCGVSVDASGEGDAGFDLSVWQDTEIGGKGEVKTRPKVRGDFLAPMKDSQGRTLEERLKADWVVLAWLRYEDADRVQIELAGYLQREHVLNLGHEHKKGENGFHCDTWLVSYKYFQPFEELEIMVNGRPGRWKKQRP